MGTSQDLTCHMSLASHRVDGSTPWRQRRSAFRRLLNAAFLRSLLMDDELMTFAMIGRSAASTCSKDIDA